MGIRQMGVPLGGAIAAVALPPLALLTSWRIALSVAGLCVIAIGVAALLLYREPPDARYGDTSGPRAGVRELLARKDIRAVVSYAFLFGAGQWCYLTYLVLYLTEAIGLSLVVAGTLLAVGQLSGAFGRVGWGLVSDRVFDGRRRPALLVVGLLAGLMTLGLALMSPDTPFFAIAGIVTLLGLSLQGWNGLTHTFVLEQAGPRVAGVAVGMTNSAGFLGVMLLPPVFGAVVDWTDSYRPAWIMLTGLILVALVSIVSIRESSDRDASV
jgi:nitrate/nitrite transporter NarK